MTDIRYRESVAYHEAGHVVVAAARGLPLSRHGMHLDSDGRGMAYYKFRKTKRFYGGPSKISRDDTLVATFAGLIAQQKFYPECSVLGADDDNNFIDEHFQEMDAEDSFPSLSCASLMAQTELRQESEKLVERHWAAIIALATALLAEPDTPRYSNEPDPNWSRSQFEKMLSGERIIAILEGFDIRASIWDLPSD